MLHIISSTQTQEWLSMHQLSDACLFIADGFYQLVNLVEGVESHFYALESDVLARGIANKIPTTQ